MEVILFNNISQRQDRRLKISQNFVLATAKNIMQEKFIEKADTFKANKGWFHRFFAQEED